jgi:hypothetical protein
MFKENPYIGVAVALGVIILVQVAVNYRTKALVGQDKILFMFIMLSSLLASVWVVDNVIAYQNELLTEKEDEEILKIMRTIIDFTLGYYFGSKAVNKSEL